MVNNHFSDNVLLDIGSYTRLAAFPLFNKNCSGFSQFSLLSKFKRTHYLSIPLALPYLCINVEILNVACKIV